MSRQEASSPTPDRTREQIIASLFTGGDRSYIAHLKVWEDVGVAEGAKPGTPAQSKPRYLLLATVRGPQTKSQLYKAKKNSNGTYSIGKTWALEDLRRVEVKGSTSFALGMSKKYRWDTERSRDQTAFLRSLIKTYNEYTNGPLPKVSGLDLPDGIQGTLVPPSAGAPDASPAYGSSAPSGYRKRSISQHSTSPPPSRAGIPISDPNGYSNSSETSSRPTTPSAATSPPFASPFRRPSSRNRPRAPSDASDKSGFSPPKDRPPAVPMPPPSITINDDRGLERAPSRSANRNAVRPALTPSNSLSSFGAEASSGRSTPADGRPLPARAASMKKASEVGRAAASSSPPTSFRPFNAQGPIPRQRSGSGSSTLSARENARVRLSRINPDMDLYGGMIDEPPAAIAEESEILEEAEDEDDPYGGAVLDEAVGQQQGDRRDDGTSVARKGSLASETSGRPHPKRSTSIASSGAGSLAPSMGTTNTGGASTGANLLRLLSRSDEDEDSTFQNVEEMLEGFEWRTGGIQGVGIGVGGMSLGGGKKGGTADLIEERLLGELAALEAANIHAIIESDDRVQLVLKHLDAAISQLDNMDSIISGYKMQLNSMGEDISHIESQNRGLQVQTSNQRVLQAELEKLLATIHVDNSALVALTHESLASREGIDNLENALAVLYKAMLQSDDADMAVASERIEEYRIMSQQFCKRLLDYLTLQFSVQSEQLLNDRARIISRSNPVLPDHTPMEEYLGQYCGLLIYVKEMDERCFQRLQAAYYAASSDLWKSQIKDFLAISKGMVKRATEEDAEISFTPPREGGLAGGLATRSGTIRRAGTVIRGEGRAKRDKTGEEVPGAEVFKRAISQLVPRLQSEQQFAVDFLQLQGNVTFAAFVNLESYFQRRAAALFGPDSARARAGGPIREIRSAMDLIFGFLQPELGGLVEEILRKDPIQLVGILAALDAQIVKASANNNEFLERLLQKLHQPLAGRFEAFVMEQVRAIEQTKLTSKKRKGVVHFIKVFPPFVQRIEAQLTEAEGLNIRLAVDGAYEKITATMFDALQAMAKLADGAGSVVPIGDKAERDEKEQMNYHVIIIENMHRFATEVSRQKNPALSALVHRAEGIYEDSVQNYLQFVLRRPLGKMIDFCDGVDSLLRSMPPNEVSLHSALSKKALKVLVKDYTAKDIRKAIEALYKRVQKHFDLDEDILGTRAAESDSAEVIVQIWKRCEDEFVREAERLRDTIEKCYKDSGTTLEFGEQDVRKPFRAVAQK